MDDEPEVDKDEVVASIMGAKDPDSMSPAAQEYKDKIREQIAKVCVTLGFVCTVLPGATAVHTCSTACVCAESCSARSTRGSWQGRVQLWRGTL